MAATQKKPKSSSSGGSSIAQLALIGIIAAIVVGLVMSPQPTQNNAANTKLGNQPITIISGPVTNATNPGAAAGQTATIIQGTGTGIASLSNSISFEFERSKNFSDSDYLNQLRGQYTFLSDLEPVILTLSDNIKTSKSKEYLVFPYKYFPALASKEEKTSFATPTVEANVGSFSRSFIVTVSPGADSVYHSFELTIPDSSDRLDDLNKADYFEGNLQITYTGLPVSASAGILDLPKNYPQDKINFDAQAGTIIFTVPLIIWYNPCKVTEAELLPNSEALKQIADCYAARAEFENLKFQGDYWDNVKSLDGALGATIDDPSMRVRFVNVPFFKEVLGNFENANSAMDKVFSSGYWNLAGNHMDLVKDRYALTFSDILYWDVANVNLVNPAHASIDKAIAASDQYKTFFGEYIDHKLQYKQALFQKEEALLKDPFVEKNINDYAEAIAYFSPNPIDKSGIVSYLTAKFGSKINLSQKLVAEKNRLDLLIKQLQAQKKLSSAWDKSLTLKQPLASLKAELSGTNSEWAAVLGSTDITEIKSLSDAELDTEISTLTTQKKSIDSLNNALSRDISIISYYKELAKAKADKPDLALLAAFDNPVVEREYRARQYLQSKYWISNLNEAYAFFDLVHAIEERRDTITALIILDKAKKGTELSQAIIDEFSKTEKQITETKIDSDTVSDLEKEQKVLVDLLAELETGNIASVANYPDNIAAVKNNAEESKDWHPVYKEQLSIMSKDPFVMRELLKLNLIKEQNKDLIAELEGQDGLGDIEPKKAVFSDNKTKDWQFANTQITQSLLEEKLFKQAFNGFIDSELNYDDYPTQKNLSAKSAPSVLAKNIAPHFSFDLGFVLDAKPEVRVKKIEFKEETTGWFGASNLSEEICNNQSWTLLPYSDEKYGYLPAFFQLRCDGTKFSLAVYNTKTKGFTVITSEVELTGAEATVAFPSGKPAIQSNDFIFLKINTETKQVLSMSFNPKTVIKVSFGGEGKTLPDYVKSFGDSYYTSFKTIQKIAKNSVPFGSFTGITYSESVPDLTKAENSGLVAGYVGLLTKTQGASQPIYSKAVSMEKIFSDIEGLNKDLLTVFKNLLFGTDKYSLQEFLPARYQTNSLAGMISDNITKQNAGTDARTTTEPMASLNNCDTATNKQLEPKLVAMQVLVKKNPAAEGPLDPLLVDVYDGRIGGWGSKLICVGAFFSTAAEEQKISDDLLAKAKPDPIAAQEKAVKPLTKTLNVDPLTGTTLLNSISFASCDQKQKICSMIFYLPNGKSFGNAKDKDITSVIIAAKDDIAGAEGSSAQTTNGLILTLSYNKNNPNYALKTLKIFNGSTEQYKLENPINVQFNAATVSNAKHAGPLYLASGLSIGMVEPIGLTFSKSGTLGYSDIETKLGIKPTSQQKQTGLVATVTNPPDEPTVITPLSAFGFSGKVDGVNPDTVYTFEWVCETKDGECPALFSYELSIAPKNCPPGFNLFCNLNGTTITVNGTDASHVFVKEGTYTIKFFVKVHGSTAVPITATRTIVVSSTTASACGEEITKQVVDAWFGTIGFPQVSLTEGTVVTGAYGNIFNGEVIHKAIITTNENDIIVWTDSERLANHLYSLDGSSKQISMDGITLSSRQNLPLEVDSIFTYGIGTRTLKKINALSPTITYCS